MKELISFLVPVWNKKQVLIAREFLLNALLFVTPLVSTNQILTGTIINCALFTLASSSWKKQNLLSITLPSLASIARGLVWGSLTKNLIYFIPVIWLSNFVLVFNFRFLKKKIDSKVFVIFESAILKGCFLIIASGLMVSLFDLPQMLKNLMGFNQMITAILGGALFLVSKKVLQKIGIKYKYK